MDLAVAPSGVGLVRFLADSPEFAGVGRATAGKLWDRFGSELYAILGAGDAGRLAELIPRTQAEIVCDAWRHQLALADCVAFFDEQGIDAGIARKAIAFWGGEAVAKLRDNPYRLLTVSPWTQVDAMARRLRLSADDPRRLVGGVEAALYERLDRKHTATPEEILVRRVAVLLRCDAVTAGRAIVEAVADGAAIPSAAGLQPAGAAHMERYVEARILWMLRRDALPDDKTASSVTAELAVFLNRRGAAGAHPPTGEQRAAVAMALLRRCSLLIGGAGVGKTSCLRVVVDAARHFGLRIWQLALAGRAAQRMSEATGAPAQTIASWLAAAADGRAETGATTLVIVDEASMLDLPTAYRLLFHMHPAARLLLVGDVAQLPPIGFGLVLHRLAAGTAVPRTELTRILRATEATGIPTVSRAIRDGDVPDLPAYVPGIDGCSFLEACPQDVVAAIGRVRGESPGDEVQVVGSVYAGAAGIDAVNAALHAANARGKPVLGRFSPGDPVIWTANDRARGLWNGSMGMVTDIRAGMLCLVLDGRQVEIGADDLDRMDLAYAVSTHKAQGSQFGTVILPVVGSRFFDRTLLYTALTRGVWRVVLVGCRKTFHEAVLRPPWSLARNVAFMA